MHGLSYSGAEPRVYLRFPKWGGMSDRIGSGAPSTPESFLACYGFGRAKVFCGAKGSDCQFL